MSESRTAPTGGDRLAKVIARSGLCSRRDAEAWIVAGRVVVNGKIVKTPAFNVTDRDRIVVDGAPLAERQGTRVWLYHKPAGLVVTEKDPEGRPTVFETVEKLGLPRVVSIGRLDINTEGLLLLTNDGGLKRVLELPATGWLRKYRVRAFGSVTQAALDKLKDGIEIEGVRYGSIEATLESERGANVWLELALREGKNREVKNVLGALGLQVNRLIRISYGPFQLADIPIGGIETVKARVLRDQLGKRLAEEADVDFDSDLPEPVIGVPLRDRETGRGTNTIQIAQQRFRFTDRPERDPGAERDEDTGPKHRPGRFDQGGRRPAPRRDERAEDTGPARHIHFDDGREAQEFRQKSYGKEKNTRTGETTDARGAGPKGFGDKGTGGKGFGDKSFGDKGGKSFAGRDAPRPGRNFDEKPKRDFGDRPKQDFADRPKRDDGDRKYTPRGDAPARAERSDRPQKAYGAKPRGTFDNKPKSFRDRPDRPSRPAEAGASRPSFSDRPRPPRDAAPGGDRPKRDYGDKSFAPRGERTPGGERAKRAFGDKPSFGDKPKSFSDRPRGSGPGGDRPRRPRPEGDSPRPTGGASKPYVKHDAGSAPSRAPRSAGAPAGNRGPRPGGGSGGRPAGGPSRPTGGPGRPGGGSGRPAGKGRPPRTRT